MIHLQKITQFTPGSVFHEIARLHVDVITEGFLSTLGTDLLGSLYRAAISSDQAFLYIARDEELGFLGFICGSYHTPRLYRGIALRVWPRLFLVMAPRIFNLAFMRKCFETAFYPARHQSVVTDLPSQEIINFCVRADCQGQGVGRRLFEQLVETYRQKGVSKFKIVTGEHQLHAQRFYEKAGAQHIGDIDLHKGSKSKVFVYETSGCEI